MGFAKFYRRAFFALCLLAGNILPALADQHSTVNGTSACITRDWPFTRSDLLPDPTIRHGILKNGFRYVLKENQEPKNRVAIHLNVQAGSLNETEEQRGYAHFLEHMLFNGSTHFKPGELVDHFQSIGMSFGTDTNAHTSTDETVYKIILPGSDRGQFEKGFLIISDFARGALLLESEIERERGVILSEKRDMDSAAYRNSVAYTNHALRGTPWPQRQPIGVDETLEKVNHLGLKNFYDAWYRPENMILVVVGDFEMREVEPLLVQYFENLATGALIQPCPDHGSLHHKGVEAFYNFEDELGYTEVSIESLWDEKPKNDSFDLRLFGIKKVLANLMLQHRLQRLQKKPDTPFTDAQHTLKNISERIGNAEISATARPGQWQQALHLLENSLRQALSYGFKQEELDRAKKESVALLEWAVITSKARDSNEIAKDITQHLNANRVYQSPEQVHDLWIPVIATITLDEINAAFREAWSHDSRLLAVTGNTVLPAEKEVQDIKEVYNAAAKESIDAFADQAKFTFPYLEVPEHGLKAVTVTHFQDINSEQLVFANGVTVNLKKTDFQLNEVLAEINIGNGKLSAPSPGLALLAKYVINDSGSGTLELPKLKEVMASSSVVTEFSLGESSAKWSGYAVKRDTERLFQVLHALVVDPGLREDVFFRVMDDTMQVYDAMEWDTRGPLNLKVYPFFASNDKRFGTPPWAEVQKVTFDEMRQWLLPELQNGMLEVSLVGDFDRDEVIQLAERYFGTLSPRTAKTVPVAPVIFASGQTLTATVRSSVDKSVVVVAWPTADYWDIGRTRRLDMLASVFDDKVRKVVREKLGATYSPQVSSSCSQVYANYGTLTAQVTVETGREQLIIDEVLNIAADLRRNGVREDELERAKEPALTLLKDTLRSNSYWLESVLAQSTRHPRKLLWPTTVLSDYRAVTAKELSELAVRYLQNERVAIARVQPEKRH